MKRVLEIIEFISNVVSAISKGAKVTAESWPATNPFKRNNLPSDLPKQSGESDKPVLSVSDKVS